MPILAKEPCVYPEDLLEESSGDEQLDIAGSGQLWWVVYTKSRQEKSLARDLVGYRLPFYLPQVQIDHLIRGKRIHAHVPLFPGYLFLYGTSEDRVDSLRTNRISRILPVPDQDELGRDLRQIAHMIATGAALTVEQRLSPGQKVRIRNGPMAGFEGLIVQRRGADRLLIAVNFLQQGVSVEINDFMVDPV
jgi:transcription antitermination factor NusG